MLTVPAVVPEAFWLGVTGAVVFGIIAGWGPFKDWMSKQPLKKRRKIKHISP
jgi:hypothetical protein